MRWAAARGFDADAASRKDAGTTTRPKPPARRDAEETRRAASSTLRPCTDAQADKAPTQKPPRDFASPPTTCHAAGVASQLKEEYGREHLQR